MNVLLEHSEHPKDLQKPMAVEDFVETGIDRDMRCYREDGQLERAEARARLVEQHLGMIVSLLCERGIMSPADLDDLVSHPKLTPIEFERRVDG